MYILYTIVDEGKTTVLGIDVSKITHFEYVQKSNENNGLLKIHFTDSNIELPFSATSIDSMGSMSTFSECIKYFAEIYTLNKKWLEFSEEGLSETDKQTYIQWIQSIIENNMKDSAEKNS